jgi:hypothetical protein
MGQKPNQEEFLNETSIRKDRGRKSRMIYGFETH